MIKISSALLTTMFLFLTQAGAHHSFAIYDIDNKITRTGILTKLQFTNPHIQFILQVDNNGKKETWKIESLNTLRWDREIGKRDVAEEGEKVTIQGWPARDGSDSMVLSTIVSPKHGKTVVVDRIRQERAREDIPAVTVKRN